MKRSSLLLVVLLAALALPARAQLWRGAAAIEVRAEDKGKPAAGAEVRLEFLDMEPPAGPAPVKLDGRGRAVVGALAEGRWRLEVSREGAMTYRAEVLVRRDGKPDVLNAVQHNVPGALSMMEVRLARARGGVAAPPPAQEVPAAAVEPLPAPAPEVKPTPEPERPAPRPTPPPQEVPVSAAEPLRPPPSPAPAPAPPSPERTVPAPVPAPPNPASAPAVRRRSFQDRTCVECRPGETSLSVEVVAPPAEGGCSDGLHDALLRLDAAALGAGCHLLRIELPRNARYVGYRYEVQEGDQSTDCMAGKDCPAGGRWPLDPVLRRDGAGNTTLATAFENLAGRERRAVLTVYFKEGSGSAAPRPMIPSQPRQEKPPGL
jgi:hypothetical protein